MEILTCLCKHCRYRIKRQKKHGGSILTNETRACRRIVKQMLKDTERAQEIDIPVKRWVYWVS